MSEQGVLDQLPDAIAKAESLPSPPTVAVEILRLSKDESASVKDLAALLARDPVLSAKVLKLANSSMFRRGDAVTSLDQATMRLGMKTVKLMALSFSLVSGMPAKSDAPGFDYAAYWSRSLTMAVAGRSLARLLGSSSGDEAFLGGLLGRLGQLVMSQCIPEAYGELLEASEGELPTREAETAALGYDFHQVGSGLLEAWGLPGLICSSVRHWGDPPAAPPSLDATALQLARVMHVGDATADVLSRSLKGHALQRLHEVGVALCGVSTEEVDAYVVSLQEDMGEMATMLDVEVDSASYQSIIDRARMEMMQISLGTAIDLEQTSSRADELERRNEELACLASTDKLTGIPNRAHFDHSLERVVEARLAGNNENALGVLILDVDHFKKFNDVHGHQVGDEVLKLVADCLKAATRDTDIAARYGGEEFVVIVPNTTLEILETVAERIRCRIESAVLEQAGERLSVTASVGGACVRRVSKLSDGEALLGLADACLYQAKDAGRNRSLCRRVETTDQLA